MTLHHTLYRKLNVLIPTLPQMSEYGKSQVPGFMDLNLDLLSRDGEIITVALSHYYEQNGDLIADPDMVVRIDTKAETVEALTFQDTYTYREVYPEGSAVDLKAKKELNEFLLQWLTNLRTLGREIKAGLGVASIRGVPCPRGSCRPRIGCVSTTCPARLSASRSLAMAGRVM